MYVPWVFNVKKSYILPTEYLYVLYVFQGKNNDVFRIQNKLIAFYNWGEKCLLYGTDWVFNP